MFSVFPLCFRRIFPFFFLFAVLGIAFFGIPVGTNPTLHAQDFQDFGEEFGGLEDLYEGGEFSFAPKKERYGFSALIAPVPQSLALESSDPGSKADAYLVVHADIAENWHLYTITQPPGGPLRGSFEVKTSEDFRLLQPLRAASEINIEYPDIWDVRVESHLLEAWWIAPIQLSEGTTVDSLKISGSFSGQVCEEVCVQINDAKFVARYDESFDVQPLIAKAEQVADQLTQLDQTEGKVQTPSDSEGSGVQGASGLSLQFQPTEVSRVDSFGWVIVFAFLGGLILNVMPCVLPVIGLKILSFFDQAGKSRSKAFVLNLCYTAGLLTVFGILAFLSVGLNTMFSYDLFNIIMVCVVFAMSLSLMDIWELKIPAFLGGKKSVELMEQEGVLGAYFKGIITTLLAIPCGAPLLSGAVLWANTQIEMGNTSNVFIAYSFIALGMGSPFLLIGAFPELLRFMPKPGMWMDTFKKIMGFFLLSAVVWIFSYISIAMFLPTLTFLFALWFACWFLGRLEFTASSSQRIKAWGISILVLAITLLFSYNLPGISHPYTLQNLMEHRLDKLNKSYLQRWMVENPDFASGAETSKDSHHWNLFTEKKFEEALLAGQPVLVDFTADWCLSCKYFEATVLDTDDIKDLIDRKGVLSLQADCTKEDWEGAQFLKKLGGSSDVPVLALFYPEIPEQPTVIRGGFTKSTVVNLLNPLSDNPLPKNSEQP